MPNSMPARTKKKTSSNIYTAFDTQLAKIIKQMDNKGRIGDDYVNFRIDEAIDSMVTAQNRIQSIIQYTSNEKSLTLDDC